MRILTSLVLLAAVACGGADEAATPAPDATPEKAAPAKAPAKADKAKGKRGKGKAKAGTDGAAKARVFFKSPADGATVTSPVKVEFGVQGMEVKPAGQLEEGTGHHHIVIGSAGIAEGKAVPKDETHIHYGGGQTEAELELEPGDYSLTMQFADGNHISYGPAMSATIAITVTE